MMGDDYWTDEPVGTVGRPDSDDDDVGGDEGVATPGLSTFTLEPLNASRTKILTFEDAPPDVMQLNLGVELFNTQIERKKLTDSKLLRFVNKIASTATASASNERRQVIVLASPELPQGRIPGNPATLEYTEIGRTNVSVDEPSPSFALPVKVTCRKGYDRMVRVQMVWAATTLGMGNESVIAQATESFTALQSHMSGMKPFTFRMSSPACPKGLGVLWGLPIADIQPPISPYISLPARRNMSFTQPYVFSKRQERSKGGVRSPGDSQPRAATTAPEESGVEQHLSPELLMARESCIEGRFAYRFPVLVFRPLIKQLEASIAAWTERYEAERLDQNFFATDADAFANGGVLVRLTVVEASGLPVLSAEEGLKDKDDYYVGPNAGRNLHIPSVSTAQSALAQRLILSSKTAERPVSCHSFVAVILDKPRPQMGVLIGHTNTEYTTQNPIYGTNANAKSCPHNRPSDDFTVYGNTRLGKGAADAGPSFMFYAQQQEVGHANLRFEVIQEGYRLHGGKVTQLCAHTQLRLDPSYLKPDVDDLNDREAWLPLVSPDGTPAGRLLVRIAVFDGRGVKSTEPPKMSAERSRVCYEWMKQAGLSGRPPRDGDIFAAPPPTTHDEGKVQLRYPLDWLRAHIDSLKKQLSSLQVSMKLWEQAASEGRGFRSSELKMVPELQPVALNVHSQTFVIADAKALPPKRPAPAPSVPDLLSFDDAPATTACSGSTRSSSCKPRKFYYDLVSTGVPAAHALGFRRGGLISNHQEIVKLQSSMQQLDARIVALGDEPFRPTGPCGEMLNELFSETLRFEAMAARLAFRRAFCVSQALSIALMSLATKLDIMLTDDADQALVTRTAQNMVRGGYLVCFQGLVSTIGKEQGMLEDAAMAMEAISQYSFELDMKRDRDLRPSVNTTAPTPPYPPNPSLGPFPVSPPARPSTEDLLSFTAPTLPPTSVSKHSASSSTKGPGAMIVSPTPVRDANAEHHATPVSPPLGYGGFNISDAAMDVEFDHVNKRVRILLDPAAIDRLPAPLQAARHGPLVIPIVACLFAQGIDAKQSVANYANQLKPTSGGTGGGARKVVGGNATIQPVINRRTLRVLNEYVHACYPVDGERERVRFDRVQERFEVGRAVVYGSAEEFQRSMDDVRWHPQLEALKEAVKRDTGTYKNVDLLREQEQVVLGIGGGQVIFCKSGKDRTGMAVTLHQSRLLERHGCGASMDRLLQDANLMRLHGTRLVVCEKNVGRLKYAFNQLQLQFMPAEYRPPSETVEDLVNSFLLRDHS